MDHPLQVLREYAQGRRTFKEIVQGNDTYYMFDGIVYDKNAKTNLTIYGRTDDYYTLESLYFIWERRDISHPAYVKEAARRSIRAVGRPDRRDLLDYLRGDRQEVPSNFDRLALPTPSIPAFRFKEFEPEHKRAKLDPSAETTVQWEAGSATSAVDESNLHELDDNSTADKIAALREKTANHQKRATVLDDMDITTDEAVPLPPSILRKLERVWHTRSNCMESRIKNNDFSCVLKVIQGLKMRDERAARNNNNVDPNPRTKPGYSRYNQEQQDTDAPKKRTCRTPIIIIPPSTNQYSIISMYNVRNVLQELSFATEDVGKQQGKLEKEVLIQRKKGDETVPYRVVDAPQRLTSEEWDRVVAVFAMGPTWQFKGWPLCKGDPNEMFHHVPGFHLTYDNANVHPNVAKLPIKVLALSPYKRHLDRARLQCFWEMVDRHIAKNKPHLRF
ncbi:unnamed protein product, partial [Mesorhabditis spiculigera]